MTIRMFVDTMIEGRDAPLYHWMDKKKTLIVLSINAMPAKWEHMIPSQGKDYVYGTSMSRNEKFNWDNGEVRITFDQSQLAMNHKIIPLDAERAFHSAQGNPDFVLDRDKAQYGYSDKIMAEEFVIGNIEPLDRYVTEIWYDGSDPQIKGVIRAYAAKYGVDVI